MAVAVISIDQLTAASSANAGDQIPASQSGSTVRLSVGMINAAISSTDIETALGFTFGSLASANPGTSLQLTGTVLDTLQLATSPVTPGVYGNGTSAVQLTVNAFGIVTAATTVPITANSPGGTTGQIQYNNAGAFGGTTAGPFFIGTDAANLTGTVSVNRFNGGTGASATSFLDGTGGWSVPSPSPAHWVVDDAVTASGSNQATATVIAANVNTITSGGTGAGVVLQGTSVFGVGEEINIRNNTVNTQNVYPDGTSAINSLGTSAAYSLFPDQGVRLIRTGASQWRNFPAS